ncbi:MAG: ABC transporter ATP-binding protein [Lachnospiraceae bacterium]|jgi:ABC-2 type transport system ATP-binding protein|nr:ABC transporter ATP-binding protein [Lachnospiraceae bacterium]
MIEITNLCKSFDKKPVIKEVSLRVAEAETLCLLGPSGAGKTTLIRLVSGAIRADAGEIVINGIKAPSMKLYAEMGFMPQGDALYNDLTGFDNLLFFGGLYGLKGKALRERALELLATLGLADDKDKLAYNYSGGMRKRLSLAIALLHKPRFLLLDEPTVGIDPILRQEIWQLFHRLEEGGATLIVSTHVMDEAAKCRRTALIYEGRIVADDTTEHLLARTNGNIEELFFMVQKGEIQ